MLKKQPYEERSDTMILRQRANESIDIFHTFPNIWEVQFFILVILIKLNKGTFAIHNSFVLDLVADKLLERKNFFRTDF